MLFDDKRLDRILLDGGLEFNIWILKEKVVRCLKNEMFRKFFYICSGVFVEINILLFIFCVNIVKFFY